jgi:FKBP-type peptidyl-prolyl cis-trans isomerase SlyD
LIEEDKMAIQTNSVVSFHYQLKDEQGQLIESSFEQRPIVYLHGHGGIIEGLEEAFIGKNAGDKFTAVVSPEKGYGLRVADAIQRIPTKHLHVEGKAEPGAMAWVQTDHGHHQVTIVKVGKFTMDVDVNHPLAGQTLTFDVEVIGVRDATEEELSHGHVHGEGGHHH